MLFFLMSTGQSCHKAWTGRIPQHPWQSDAELVQICDWSDRNWFVVIINWPFFFFLHWRLLDYLTSLWLRINLW